MHLLDLIFSYCCLKNVRSDNCINSGFALIKLFDRDALQGDCLSAIAVQLLLKLKRHLKIMYGLNDARCQVIYISHLVMI